ncbi:Thioredoxin-like fold [Vigna unguiculata]|uniref:Thioredoxin-like fold n=1 Tax=Vigna unguiculata TaxID=3917 RepID=A0A4D6L423_VIGUN|nr:Thioredoxin-like fold [Vigna unguiculata]
MGMEWDSVSFSPRWMTRMHAMPTPHQPFRATAAGFAERVSGEVFARGSETGVVYTTSLRGVRKTFEDYNRVHRVVFDERDVSLHREFLREVKELVGEAVALPWVFVKGRYMGVWRNWWS